MSIPGYGGKIVKINLTTSSITTEDISRDLARLFVGGKGLGTYLLLENLRNWNVDPLSSDNVLVIASGPFNGTMIPLGIRATLVFKSPLTGIYGESVIGGSFGAFMKWVGVDALVITGKAEKPMYIFIDDDRIELRSAEHIWGKGIFKTEDILHEELGKNISILAIGPAGENLVRFAAVGHEYYRQAGRCGGGAVMGSKNLKAIAIKASRREVSYHDEERVRDIVLELHKKIKENPSIQSYAARGTPGFVEKANVLGFFPTKYWSKVRFEKFKNIIWESLGKYRVGKRTCYGCPVACHQYIEINEPPYANVKVTLEYETIFALGGLCEIDDIRAIAYMNMLMDDYGIDTITGGNVLAFAIEAYQRGKLKSEKELKYNDPDSMCWLLERIVKRVDIGDLLAEGVAKAANVLGLKDIAVHVKGLEPPGYDPRTLKGMILSYAVSPRGACHLRLMGYHADLMGLGGGRFSTGKEKVEVLVDLENRGIFYDSLPVCKFGRFIFDWDVMRDLLNAVTGFNYDIEELRTIANRIRTLIRVFNVKLGIKKENDYLPRRFLKETVEYDGKMYRVTEEELNNMLNTYYELRGWNSKGIPTEDTLRKLGIDTLLRKWGIKF